MSDDLRDLNLARLFSAIINEFAYDDRDSQGIAIAKMIRHYSDTQKSMFSFHGAIEQILDDIPYLFPPDKEEDSDDPK